jgi:hypothetical protein
VAEGCRRSAQGDNTNIPTYTTIPNVTVQTQALSTEELHQVEAQSDGVKLAAVVGLVRKASKIGNCSSSTASPGCDGTKQLAEKMYENCARAADRLIRV